ncbi:hypothetical protein CsatA_007739 [Cannabis sativa]
MDSWLPGYTDFTPYCFIGSDPSIQVADLIDEHRNWDLVAISTNFGQKLKIPSKLRIFVWKVFHNALPVTAELNRKHISDTPFCPLCKAHRETINHALFFCTRAKEVWHLSHLTFDLKMAVTSTPDEFLLYVSANTSSFEFESFLVCCWSIKFERNAEYNEKLTKLPAAILAFATDYLAKYQAVHAPTMNSTSLAGPSTTPAPASTMVPPVTPWTAPPVGKFKLNTDAVCNKALGIIGIGAVLIDSSGLIIDALSKPMKGCFKPEEMEALALAQTLKWSINLCLSAEFIETDSLMVVQGLKTAFTCNSTFHTILKNVKYLVSFFPRVQVAHVKRFAKTYAHVLAKFALTVDVDCSWLEEFPPPLMTIM